MKRGPTAPPAGRRGPFSLKSRILDLFGLRSGPDRSGQPIRFIWSLFRAKPSILDPFRTKFDVLGPDQTLADVADMSRRPPTSPDGRLDRPVSVYYYDTDPYGSPTSPDDP